MRSTPACCRLKEPARNASSVVQPLSGYRGRPPPGTAGGRPRCGSATLERRPWPAPLASTLSAVTGITNKNLRALMTGLLGIPYTVNQASYDLARLARNGLIDKVPERNRSLTSSSGLPGSTSPLVGPEQPVRHPGGSELIRGDFTRNSRLITNRQRELLSVTIESPSSPLNYRFYTGCVKYRMPEAKPCSAIVRRSRRAMSS